jgi:hypothetical protein
VKEVVELIESIFSQFDFPVPTFQDHLVAPHVSGKSDSVSENLKVSVLLAAKEPNQFRIRKGKFLHYPGCLFR